MSDSNYSWEPVWLSPPSEQPSSSGSTVTPGDRLRFAAVVCCLPGLLAGVLFALIWFGILVLLGVLISQFEEV